MDLLVDHAVRHDNRLIVTGRRKQRITRMVSGTTNSILVQANRLIWFGGQIQVEPEHLLVVRRYQQIVTLRMNRHVRNPFTVREQFLNEFLLDEVVYSNVFLGLWLEINDIRNINKIF